MVCRLQLGLKLWTDHEPTRACQALQVDLHLILLRSLLMLLIVLGVGAGKQGNFVVIEGYRLLKRLRIGAERLLRVVTFLQVLVVLPGYWLILVVIGGGQIV